MARRAWRRWTRQQRRRDKLPPVKDNETVSSALGLHFELFAASGAHYVLIYFHLFHFHTGRPMEKGIHPTLKLDEAEGFGCQGLSIWTIWILLSHFCYENFQMFSLSYWEANSYYPRRFKYNGIRYSVVLPTSEILWIRAGHHLQIREQQRYRANIKWLNFNGHERIMYSFNYPIVAATTQIQPTIMYISISICLTTEYPIHWLI